MTDVISYRTEKGEELKKLAKEKNSSVSHVTAEIIEEFFSFRPPFDIIIGYKDFRDALDSFIEKADESTIKKAIEISSLEAIQIVELQKDDSLNTIAGIIKSFFIYNNMELREIDKDSFLKLACKNQMCKNWNVYASNIIVNIFNNFGYEGLVESIEPGFFSIRIAKQKSL
jgi:hypothetical protein